MAIVSSEMLKEDEQGISDLSTSILTDEEEGFARELLDRRRWR